MPPAKFGPPVPASEGLQTHALGSVAAGINFKLYTSILLDTWTCRVVRTVVPHTNLQIQLVKRS